MLRACLVAGSVGALVAGPGLSFAAAAVALRPPLLPIEARPLDGGPISTGVPELLAVRINGVDQADSALVFRLPGGALAVSLATLASWRLAVPAGGQVSIEHESHVRLDAVAGLRWRVEPREQILMIDVGANAFQRNGIEVVGAPAAVPLAAIAGSYINYDASYQRDSSSVAGARAYAAASGFVDAAASTSFGTGRTSVVARSGAQQPLLTRLDSTWVIDRPADLTSIQLGDTIGATGQWGRAVRFAGARWSTDFSTRPGFVSFPLPAVRGEATVPSVVDLYVNNSHQLQGNVPPGPFDLADVPVVTGQGQIRMVVRDLLGREQVITQPYYVTPALLRSGLHDFSLEAGAVRRDYGLASFRYGRLQMTGTDRAGVSDTVTREIRFEVLRSQQTLGAGAVVLVDQAALLNGAVAASHSAAGAGFLVVGGAERQAAAWSASVQGRYASANFQQLGQQYGASAPMRLSVSGSVARTLGNAGISANVIVQSDWLGRRFATTALNYGRKVDLLGYVGLYASRTTGSGRGSVLGVSLTQSFGSNASASESFFRSRDGQGEATASHPSDHATVQIQASPEGETGFGYRVLGEAGASRRATADGAWQNEVATVTAGVARQGRNEGIRAGASGGIAFMPEGVFFARRIDGSFAVVEVSDYPGVRVTRDNQVVARTDRRGMAFVGGLRGYESNRIGIDAADLPLDAQVDQLDIAVSPPSRTGVSITFPVKRMRSATLRVVDANGGALAAGSSVRLDGLPREFPVGFDGRIFLVGLGDRHRAVATLAGGSCRFEVEWQPTPDDVADLGVAVCR